MSDAAENTTTVAVRYRSRKSSPSIRVSANDVAQQRQAMKKAGASAAPAPTEPAPAATKSVGNGRLKPGRKPGRKPTQAVTPATTQSALASGSPVDLIDKTLALAQECGGFEQLKRLVDRLAGV